MPKISFYRGSWAQDCAPIQFWDFPPIAFFLKILSLKSENIHTAHSVLVGCNPVLVHACLLQGTLAALPN